MVSSVSEFIRTDAPVFYGKVARYPHKPILETKYRFETRFGDIVDLHEVVTIDGVKFVDLPRALCPIGPNDQRCDGPITLFPKCPQPRPNQVEMFAEVEGFIKEKLSGLVEAYTGFGKTVVGYLATYHAKVKTLVITTKEDIYQQWIDQACGRVSASNPKGLNFLGLKPEEVGEIRGDKCEVIGTKFCVALIQSLSKEDKYPEWLANQFGLVIFDECHRVPADTFAIVARMFNARIRLGLSATLERSDGKELVIQAHIGPVRARTDAQLMVPKVIRYRTGWNVPMVRRRDPSSGMTTIIKLPHSAGRTTHVEKMMAADPVRNELIVDIIETAFLKGRKTVIFSTLIDHLETLMAATINRKISGKHCGIYRAVSKRIEKEEREKIKVKSCIFTTFMMMSEGTDIPWLDTAVFAMPRANVTQPAGRVRREYPDKQFPLLIDLIDGDSPVFAGYAAKRKAWYNSIGAEVEDLETE